MAFDLKVRFGGREAVDRALENVADRVEDLRPAFLKINKHFERLLMPRQFHSEGAFGGAPWPPLAPATLAQRAQPGRGRGGTLRDTNLLWASLVKMSTYSVRVIEKDRFERGTTRPGAVAHQLGIGVPQRQIIPEPLPPGVANTYSEIVLEYVEEAW